MRFPSYFLLGGLTVLLAVGCSYRGKCHTSRFENTADCCQSCAGNIQPAVLQRLRTAQAKFAAFASQTGTQADQADTMSEVESKPIESARPTPQVAKSNVAKSVEVRPDYSIEELVPYENTQLRIPPSKPSLSVSTSSRIPYLTGQNQLPNDEIVASDPVAESEAGSEDYRIAANPFHAIPNLAVETNNTVSDSAESAETESDQEIPPTDKLTAPAKSVLDSSSSFSFERADDEPVDEDDNLIWQEESISKTVEGVVTLPEPASQREPVLAEPADQVVTGKVEKQVVLRARPQYRGSFIDAITQNASQPNRPEPQVIPVEPVQQPFEMEPVNFQPLPTIQSAQLEVISIAQPADLTTANLDDPLPKNLPNRVFTMPNMVPIVTQKPASQATTPKVSTNRVPMIQASSKKILKAFPQTDSATRLLKQHSVASPLLNNPTEILRLRATTGLSSEQRFPPIVRFNTQALSNHQSLEANQNEFSDPRQIKLLPSNVDEADLPSFENAPMIDHARVNESIRRLTVRPKSENQPEVQTIDR